MRCGCCAPKGIQHHCGLQTARHCAMLCFTLVLVCLCWHCWPGIKSWWDKGNVICGWGARVYGRGVTDPIWPAGFFEFGLDLLETTPEISCFLRHVNKPLPSGGFPPAPAGGLSLWGPLFKQAQGMWCQRYKRSAGRAGIGSQPLPACIKASDCARWNSARGCYYKYRFIFFSFKLLLFSLHLFNHSLHRPLAVSTHPFDSTQPILVLVYYNLFSFQCSKPGEKSTAVQLIHGVQIK